MGEEKHFVYLTDDELLCLEGKTAREEIVKEIEAVKRLKAMEAEGVPAWFAPVIASAIEKGILETRFHEGCDCEKCGRKSCVRPLYKAGPKKGQPNYNRKSWVERRMVVADVHFCNECYETFVKPEIAKLAKTETRFEITGGLVVKETMTKCPKCKGECWDFDMGLKMTLMDSDGRYYGKCPHCGFESAVFGPSFEITGQFRVVAIEGLKVVKPGRFTYYQRVRVADAPGE